MKKVNKSSSPTELTAFLRANSQASWNHFKSHGRTAYQQTKKTLLADQGGLCAYCEKKLDNLPIHLQRVEHFHPKSDTSDPNKNWNLEWQNLLAVCTGGSQISDTDHRQHPLPDNLSCDAYKDTCITANKLNVDCEGYVLNPLELNSTLCFFSFDKATGELRPNEQFCQTVNFTGTNNYANFYELLTKTIQFLNLNCQRLCDDRLVVLKHYNQEIAKARRIGDKLIHRKIASRWFSETWPSFFTTRRILLGDHAEIVLTKQNYNG